MEHLRNRSLIVTALLLLSPLGPAVAGETIPRERAESFTDALVNKNPEAAGAHFSPAVRAGLPPSELARLIPTLETQMGRLNSRDDIREGCMGELRSTWQQLGFERGNLDVRLSFDTENLIAGVWFVAPEDAAPCADQPSSDANPGRTQDHAQRPPPREPLPDGVTEQPIEVGAEGWPLEGRLLLPAGDGRFPVVVLVHGSGPHDADETIHANTPFRDLADALVRHDIATLRYVKRTKAHGIQLQHDLPDFTIDDEVVDDALTAIAAARRHHRIDPARVFVLGHSLGGMLAPRIAAKSKDVAGIMVLAGPSRRLEDIILEQLADLGADQPGFEAKQADWVRRHARVKALAGGTAADGPLLLDLPASYWRSLNSYDQIATARQLDRPMLFLQGERDYQVTMVDLEGWRAGLGDTNHATFRSYPELDHLFIAGTGLSRPADYQRRGTMNSRVPDDIATWIARTTGDRQ